jgi:transposase
MVFYSKLHKSQKDKVKVDRIKTILLLHKGFSNEEISDILLIDEDTVTNNKKRFLSRSDDVSWINDSYVRCTGKLSYTEIGWLTRYINENTLATSERIGMIIKHMFGKEYEKSGVIKLLHRIGMTFKKAHKLPGGVNVEKQKEFVENFHGLMAKLTEKESVMFMDGVHPEHNTSSEGMWMEKGTERWIPSNTGREHLNINGAYNPLTAEVVVVESPTINSSVTEELLKKISDKYPEKETIYVIADNARYNKCQEVNRFIESQTKIKMMYLPPYSPNLNLIERLWKFMRKKTMGLKYYSTFVAFKKNVMSFFEHISVFKEELLRLITLKFQTFDNCNCSCEFGINRKPFSQ